MASLANFCGLSPGLNFLIASVFFALLALLSFPHLLPDRQKGGASGDASDDSGAERRKIPFFVLFRGVLALLAYETEGSVAEWGTVCMVEEKAASDSSAALVYGIFSTSSFIGRLFMDKIRAKIGDFLPMTVGAFVAALCYGIVLWTPSIDMCFATYAVMGLGFSPFVPTFFSLAGRLPGISPHRACSIVGAFAYSGLPFFPPAIGWIATVLSLQSAMVLVACVCLTVALASLFIKPSYLSAARTE